MVKGFGLVQTLGLGVKMPQSYHNSLTTTYIPKKPFSYLMLMKDKKQGCGHHVGGQFRG